jgi:hypothetical protein
VRARGRRQAKTSKNTQNIEKLGRSVVNLQDLMIDITSRMGILAMQSFLNRRRDYVLLGTILSHFSATLRHSRG